MKRENRRMNGQRTHGMVDGPDSEKGFTLLEGMIASAILAVGLLGMAAVQGMAMVKNVDANELTRVTTLAGDIFERIQFNRRNVSAYDGINTKNTANCTTINATTQLQARGDCLMWDGMVKATQLEGIGGTVAVSTVIAPIVLGRRNVTVTLTWTGSMKSGSSNKRTRTVTFNRVIATE